MTSKARVASLSIWTLLVLLPACFAEGEKHPDPFHDEINHVYNFAPHTLTTTQISARSSELDKYWDKVKANGSTYLPALRRELADYTNPPFFLYDGSMLLLSLSNTPADRKIAIAAIARCDLRDVKQDEYFRLVHKMAALGEDTTAAAFHVLEDPQFHVVVPQHALLLGQNYSLIYMLMPTDMTYWLKPAMERLRSEKDETAQKSLLLLLWYAQTESADQSLSSFAGDIKKPAPVRQYARELLHRKDSVGAPQKAAGLLSSEDSLRQKRRERMKAVSDEALIDFDRYTAEIIAKRK